MADILIRGMEMPKEEEISKFVIIRYDGEVWIGESDNLVDGGFVACYPTNPMRAVPLPAGHGRMIDADELRKAMYHEAFETDSPMQKWESGCWIRYKMFERNLENAPTIVPAEGGNADG